jgi:uncharacterized protein involved in type VI secretion and phage assembly
MHQGVKRLIFQGGSPSLLLENGVHSRSFENKTLEEIITQVVSPYPSNLVKFKINPTYKEKLNYVVQYNESDYQFLKRLTQRYGEYFYYSGEEFVVSFWGGGKVVELVEREDLYDYEIKMEIQPQGFTYTAYDPQYSAYYTADSQNQKLQDPVNPFQHHAEKKSKILFNVPPTRHEEASLLPGQEYGLEQSVRKEKQKRQHLVHVQASGNNPNLRVGDIAKMAARIPGYEPFGAGFESEPIPIESYKVTEIEHLFSESEGYRHHFKGVPLDLIVPEDYDPNNYPRAGLQHAQVVDNKDPQKMGRVRVQLPWQREENQQTPWVQVIQLHAGKGKGTYLTPEIGETVLVDFRGGNAECPIVVGAAYNGEEIAEYYREGNDLKVIQTRSGTRIVFNDQEGSILITDPSGNSWYMDGKGNMEVEAPKNFSVRAGENVCISAGKDISLNAGKDMDTSVGNDSNCRIGKQYTLSAENISETATNGKISQADEIEETGGIIEKNAESDITTQSETQVKTNSKDKSSLF